MANQYSKDELKMLVEDITDKVSGQSDLDWSEICSKHGDKVSPETLRKAGVGLRLAIEAGVLSQKDVTLNAIADEADEIVTPDYIQKQLDEIYKAKRRLYDQRRLYNRQLTEDARWEHLTDELLSAIDGLPSLPKPQVPSLSMRYGQEQSEAVLFLSDWHYGLTADNAWNEYSEEIALHRIGELRDNTVRYIKRHSPSVLHVVILGDMFEGVLRPSSQIEASELGCSQIMKVSEILANFVGDVAAHVGQLNIYSTWGNHGRTVQKYVDSIHSDNLERLIPWWMRERLSRFANIEFIDGFNEFIRIDVCGKTIAAVHGDLDTKNALASVAGAIFNKQFGIIPSYVCMGHVHHSYQMDNLGTVTFTVGSLCGTDSYANGKRLYATPNQTLLFFTPAHGLECRYDIGFSR